ncbi:MAG: MBL fold metallo-hydrolase [Acetobacteraceae bacterium]|jgi:glyoxylase-like metal-dependent hydrolase (beta-lactamase superfamily II)
MFHRFKIGTMDAAIVSDGPLTLHAPEQIFIGPKPPVLAASLTSAGLPTDRIRVEQNCLLLETAGKKVLFDNGLGSEKLYGPDSGRVLDSLREAGVAPTEIDAVVLTHAHSDHCWGTMGDDGTPNFPNATLYMSQAELDFWTAVPSGSRTARSVAGVNKHILPLRDRIRLIRDEEEFLPGVHALATPGHTPGHMAFLFDGGWCLTGDVAFHDPLSYTFPEAESLYDTDRDLGVKTRRRLLDRLVSDRLSIVGYHHPWPGLGRLERVAGMFRFLPGAEGVTAPAR